MLPDDSIYELNLLGWLKDARARNLSSRLHSKKAKRKNETIWSEHESKQGSSWMGFLLLIMLSPMLRSAESSEIDGNK